MISKFFGLSRTAKRAIMLIFDVCIIIITLFASFSMRLGEWYWLSSDVIWLIIAAPFIAIPIFIRFGLYHAIIRYIGFKALWSIIQAVSLYALIWGALVMLSGTAISSVPRSVTVINWVVSILLIGGSRMIIRWWAAGLFGKEESKIPQRLNQVKSIIIYGAGEAGAQLSAALHYSSELNPIAFLDDDITLQKQQVNGLRIYSAADLPKLVKKYQVEEILLAIPSASRERKRDIIAKIEHHAIRVRTLPSVAEIVQGKVKLEDLREVNIDDLLGRDTISPNNNLLFANIENKVVMVTGAGGSIGSELCRQIIALRPKQLILFEQNELALYQIEKELLGFSNINIVPVLGSVTHEMRIKRVCEHFSVQTIYHAAAYKHVPMVEKNTIEGVQNNIFGTLRCACAAAKAKVETFVLISTDKAVRPTNTMGATKRFAELILQALAHRREFSTRFTMVRFGNVLGSSGSVVPLFREQIRRGGPVTVTDPNIIRYFMTIPEAAQLVIQAGAMGQGGDVFVLDMGEPVRILDLAKRMIRLSGLDIKSETNPAGDIEIIFTGLRPGEKLYEELLIGDNVSSTQHTRIMRAEEEVLPWESVDSLLTQMNQASHQGDQIEIRKLLLEGVSGFKPQCSIVDVLNTNNSLKTEI